ncbi:MAG: RimK/LysX family protein [Thiovulaceae bacterium]|nr:RimK/LysX family protein [Sulfurimonadaceae bacterium]
MEVIGYLEKVNIPQLKLFGLDAKIDTGADNCSIHCDEITINSDNTVTFILHDEVHQAYHGKAITLPIHKTKKVKSSNGKSEERIFIQSGLKLGHETYEAEISLANRENMKYPLLIGRRFLSHHYLIDVSKKYLTKESL